MANKYADPVRDALKLQRLHRRIHRGGALVCARKRAHATAADAIQWQQARGHPVLRPYRCPHCTGWHLTKQPLATGDDE